jgi:hypothetical protein
MKPANARPKLIKIGELLGRTMAYWLADAVSAAYVVNGCNVWQLRNNAQRR